MSQGDPIWSDDDNPLSFTSEGFRVILGKFTENARFLAKLISELSPEDKEKWLDWIKSGDTGQYTTLLFAVTDVAK